LPIVCIVLLLISCSTAPIKPNASALYRIPSLRVQLPSLLAKSQPLTQESPLVEIETLFQRIYTLDPILALEVGKLPEFQNKVGQRQIFYLHRFVNLIKKATSE